MGRQPPPKIAVVDDDEDLSPLVAGALRDRGYEVDVFDDGAEALLAIPQFGGYAAVITDLSMPRLDGLSLCRALRASFTPEQLPIVVLSSRAQEADIVAAHSYGANDYLIKPFTPAMLLAKIGLLVPPPTRARDRAALLRPPKLDLADPQVPSTFADYELLEVLDRGGYAVVFRARRLNTDESVALKVLSLEDCPAEDLGRYFREVAILALIDSPYVVRILDHGEEGGYPYLAMELLPGGSTAEEVARSGPWTLPRALQLGVEVCEALSALHDHGLVHRDVKAKNVLLREDGSAVLIDMGLAKASRDHSLTDGSIFMGTLEYVAPEVIAGESVESSASDLYSLGMLLYKLISGRLPFVGGRDYDLAQRILDEPPPPLCSVAPAATPLVSDLMDCLLAKDPRDRIDMRQTQALLGKALRELRGAEESPG